MTTSYALMAETYITAHGRPGAEARPAALRSHRPGRGKSGCWSLPDRMGILTDPVRQVTMALGMMRGVVDALARLRS